MIKFNKIENGNIFTRDFRPLAKNNEVHFSNTEGIAVVYGPNGTGKTSLIKVLADGNGTAVEFEYEGKKYASGKDVFHIIINEFNHFEGNLSIFQPAIDITDHALGSERTDIVSFVNSL